MTSSVQLSLGESRISNSYDFPFYECDKPNLYIFHVDYSGLGIWIISGRFQFVGDLPGHSDVGDFMMVKNLRC